MKIAHATVTTKYIDFKGGLDKASPAMAVSPGAMIDCRNYEPSVAGGYQRIDGYEIFSGQPAPSDAVYYYCETTLTTTVAVGDTITGVTSSATGYVVATATGSLSVTKVTGTFAVEAITVGGSAVGTIDTLPSPDGHVDISAHTVDRAAAADLYRADIAAPVGSGPGRGLALLKGVLYCFRDNAAGDAGVIHKSTAAGWVEVDLDKEIYFTDGVATIPDGTVIIQDTSTAVGIVQRTVLESGVWGSTAAGRLIITVSSGTFNDSDVIKVGGVTAVTAASLATDITITPGGRYETVLYNFGASLDTRRIYGADGKNRGFEFDGNVYVPINTGMAVDTPEYVHAFKYQLFFSFRGSSQGSGVGYPYVWTVITGANEIGLGDDITGYIALPGKALGILSRDSSDQLNGNSVDDFYLDPISDEVGCIPRTAQRVGTAFCLDDRGVIAIIPSDKFGNFEQSTVSRKVQPLIDEMRKVVVASAVYRSRNQYRLYGSDGTGICMTLFTDSVAFTAFQYPDNVACTVSGEDADGKDVMFFCDDVGNVYQGDKGTSFNGAAIESWAIFPYNHFETPSVLKTFRKVTVEMTAEEYAVLKFSPDLSYGDPDLSASSTEDVSANGFGGTWDVAAWGAFFYDARYRSVESVRVNGTGTNMGFTIYGSSSIDKGHKLDGMIVHYTPRRLSR